MTQFSVLLLFSTSFSSLIEAACILVLHSAIFLPFEVARTLYRNSRYFSKRQHLTLFQAAVFSIVRVAFAYVCPCPFSPNLHGLAEGLRIQFDPEIARVFFSTANSEPFVKRRLGPLWNTCRSFYEPRQAVGGWWIAEDDKALHNLASGAGPKADRLVIMYVHGGGFALGSPTFYLEFLARLRSQLATAHPSLHNVAIFAPYVSPFPSERSIALTLPDFSTLWLQNPNTPRKALLLNELTNTFQRMQAWSRHVWLWLVTVLVLASALVSCRRSPKVNCKYRSLNKLSSSHPGTTSNLIQPTPPSSKMRPMILLIPWLFATLPGCC